MRLILAFTLTIFLVSGASAQNPFGNMLKDFGNVTDQLKLEPSSPPLFGEKETPVEKKSQKLTPQQIKAYWKEIDAVKDFRKKHPTALKYLNLLANNGDSRAQYKLGWQYMTGRMGLKKDGKVAIRLLTLSANQGNAKAQNTLGEIYGYPDWEVLNKRDYKTATKWWKLSAKQGNSGAQKALGEMYEKGQGVAKNLKLAKQWYKRAAAQKGASAEFAQESLTRLSSPYQTKSLKTTLDTLSKHYLNHDVYMAMCRKDYAKVIPNTKKLFSLYRKYYGDIKKELGPYGNRKKWNTLKDDAYKMAIPKIKAWKEKNASMLFMYAALSDDQLRQGCSSNGDVGKTVIMPLRMVNNMLQREINKSSGSTPKRKF